jgi:hypothetical protein
LEGIDDFFWREGNADPPTRIHCYRCISSAAPPDPNPDSIKAITLSNALDLRILRETLLNREIRDLETEMTKWATTQHESMIEQMVEIITTNDKNTIIDHTNQIYKLDDRVKDWTAKYKAKIQTYVRDTLINISKENIIDSWVKECLENTINERKAFVAREKTRITQESEQELLVFKNNLKVKMDEEKNKLEEQAIVNIRKQTNATNTPKRKNTNKLPNKNKK